MEIATSLHHSIAVTIVENEDYVLSSNKKSALSMWQGVVVILNYMIGVGLVSHYRHFRCGILLASFVNFFLAFVTYFSCDILFIGMQHLKKLRLESLWIERGFKLSFLIALFIFFPSLSFASLYFITIKNYLDKILDNYFPNRMYWLTDPYVLGLFIILVLIVPVLMTQNLKINVLLSCIGMATTMIIFIISAYWFVVNLKNNGFNHKNDIKLVDFSNGFFDCFARYIGSYFTYTIISTVMMQVRSVTVRKTKKIMRISLIYYSIFIEIVALIQYFTIYDVDDDSDIFENLNLDISVIIAIALMILKLLCTLPVCIYPAIEATFSLIIIQDQYPKLFWIFVVIVCCMSCLLISYIATSTQMIFAGFVNCVVLFMQFIFPTLLISKFLSEIKPFFIVIAIIISLLGFGLIIYSLYDTILII